MFTVAGFIPFKICDVIDALPHASCVVGVELFFNFVFILSFGGFDGFQYLRGVKLDKLGGRMS